MLLSLLPSSSSSGTTSSTSSSACYYRQTNLVSSLLVILVAVFSSANFGQASAASLIPAEQAIDSPSLWHTPEGKRAQASNYIRFGKRSDAATSNSNEEEVALVPQAAGEEDTLAPIKRTKESGYIRFGKRVPDGYIRFGKRAGTEDQKGFIRFGRAQKEAFIRFGKRAKGDAFIRFGRSNAATNKRKAADNYIRFGKRGSPVYFPILDCSEDAFHQVEKYPQISWHLANYCMSQLQDEE